MKIDEKRVWLPYRITEPKQLERYFEQMAEEGWHPESVGKYTAKFRRGKPRKLRYCVDFTEIGRDEAELQRYTTLCADAGWRFRLRAQEGWLLFFTKDASLTPLQTDDKLALRNFQKAFRRSILDNSSLLILWAIWTLLDLGFGVGKGSKVRILSGWNTMVKLFCLLLFVMVLLFLAVNAVTGIVGYLAAGRAMKKGTPIPEISRKTARWRVIRRRAMLWSCGVLLGLSILYDAWAGNIRPQAEQWIAMTLGAAVFVGGFFLKKKWLDRMARKIAWGVGIFFFALGLVMAYPLYRMEPIDFGPEAPVVQAEELLPGAEVRTHTSEYGRTPLYERWEVYESGSVQVGENEYQSVTVSYTAYRACSRGITKRLAWEEAETIRQIFSSTSRRDLDWPVEEAYLVGDFALILRDGNGVISYFLAGDDPEQYRKILLQKMEMLNTEQ